MAIYGTPTTAGVTISIFETDMSESIEFLQSQNLLKLFWLLVTPLIFATLAAYFLTHPSKKMI